MAGCGAKIILFTINFIFLLCGIAVLVFGIVTLSSPSTVIGFLDWIPGYLQINYIIDVQQAVINGGIVMTVIGSVLVVLCVFGLVTSCTSSKWLHIIYIVLVLLILYFEVAVIIFFSIDSQFINNRIENLMFTSLVENFEPVNININNGAITNGSSPGGQAWEALQFTYACCGAHGYKDYQQVSFNVSNYPSAIVPPSCCQQIQQYQIPTLTSQLTNFNECMTANTSEPNYINTKGCYIALSDLFFVYGYVKMIVLSGLIAIEVAVLMLSCRLMNLHSKESGIGDY
jgi:hypothetical protein